MSDTFGGLLRQHREQRGTTLEAVAQLTKIKLSLLDGLERGDVSQWPAGIFRRAYVRAYAHAIGLDPDATVREFLDAHPDPVELPIEPPASSRLRGLFGSALGSLSRRHPLKDVDTPPPAAAPMPTRLIAPVAPATPRPDESEPAPIATSMRVEAKEPDLLAAAALCTNLGRIDAVAGVQPLLGEAARILDAAGLIVWLWDPSASALRPALLHGYPDQLRVQLGVVKPEDDNATASALRSGEICQVSASDTATGALAVPLLSPGGCVGVLAVELPRGREQIVSVQAIATLVAAMLAQLFGGEAVATPARQRA